MDENVYFHSNTKDKPTPNVPQWTMKMANPGVRLALNLEMRFHKMVTTGLTANPIVQEVNLTR